MAKRYDGGRLPMLSIDEAKTAAANVGIPDIMAPLSVFRTLLHHPKLAQALSGLLSTLLLEPKLDARLRELIIMRIGWVTGSVYEWTQHWRIARGLGMSEEDIVGVRDWQSHAGYGPPEKAVLAATDETIRAGSISDATWEQCTRHVGDTGALLEMVVAIGNWRLFSSLLRSLEIPLEDGVAPWPPDGRVPR